MPDDVKIPVGAPGARKAARDLRGVAAAQRQVGQAGGAAGKKLAGGYERAQGRLNRLNKRVKELRWNMQRAGGGTDAQRLKLRRMSDTAARLGKRLKRVGEDGSGALNKLGQAAGVNTSLFANWQLAAVAAGAAVVAMVMRAREAMKELRREMRQWYREFVDLSRQPMTGALARIRGATEADTVGWMHRTGRKYSIAPEEARDMAFEMESGLDPAQVGGKAAFEDIQDAGYKFMRAEKASGGTASGLAIAAFEAGIATRPADFKRFYAKVSAYAGKSKVSPEQIGQIAAELLPAAVAAGISEDQFLAMASAMSFRIKRPDLLRTTLERMIRAAGTNSEGLSRAAEATGRKLGQMSAVEIMELQSDIISGAMRDRGVQGAMAAAEQLKLPAELAQIYPKAFDPAVRRRMRGLLAIGSAATWEGTVGSRYREVRGSTESQEYSSRLGKQQAKQRAGQENALFAVLENRAEAKVTEMMGAGENIPGVWEAGPRGKEKAIRKYILDYLYEAVARIDPESLPDDQARREWRDASGDITTAGILGYRSSGAGEERVQSAARFAQRYGDVYQGGTHYHINDGRDPAGQAAAPKGGY